MKRFWTFFTWYREILLAFLGELLQALPRALTLTSCVRTHLRGRKMGNTSVSGNSRNLEPLKHKYVFTFFGIAYVRILKILAPKFLQKAVFYNSRNI